jgi:hypothetical protein
LLNHIFAIGSQDAILEGACALEARPGCHLTTLFGIESVPTLSAIPAPAAPTIPAAAAPKKHGWLPVLTVLFLISYGLMTMLIVEQGRTIESQRALIRELFHDSTELSAIKKAAQESAQPSSAQTQAQETQTLPTQTPSTQVPLARTPSTQTPSTQTQASQTPSSQAGPQQRAQNQSAKQKAFRMPSKPEPDLVDDVRTLIVI